MFIHQLNVKSIKYSSDVANLRVFDLWVLSGCGMLIVLFKDFVK